MKYLYRLLSRLFRVSGKRPTTVPTFLAVLSEYMSKEITANKLTESTRYKYGQIEKNITRFLSDAGLRHICPDEFKIKTAEGLVTWLHSNLSSCTKTHSARHVEMCSRVLDYCVRCEYIKHNPLPSLKLKRDRPKEVIQLDPPEIALFTSYPFVSDILRGAADLFVFQCYSGLSYGDLDGVTLIETEGSQWFSNPRIKTATHYWVPAMPEAVRVYHKYKGKLPTFTNGAYNRFLKEIAVLLGIKKHLTSHVARKTFATLLHDAGYSNEAIKDMLGHLSTRTTETHYIRINRNRIKQELATYKELPAA